MDSLTWFASETSKDGQMVETLIVGVVVGIVLLLIEYKTHLFAQSLSSLQSKSKRPRPTFVSRVVAPILEFKDPTADWLQVAEKVKAHLAQSIAEELNGPISLWEVKPQRNSALLIFYCLGTDGNGYKIRIVADREGHVCQLQRDFEGSLQ
jgi:hypothetical protein